MRIAEHVACAALDNCILVHTRVKRTWSSTQRSVSTSNGFTHTSEPIAAKATAQASRTGGDNSHAPVSCTAETRCGCVRTWRCCDRGAASGVVSFLCKYSGSECCLASSLCKHGLSSFCWLQVAAIDSHELHELPVGVMRARSALVAATIGSSLPMTDEIGLADLSARPLCTRGCGGRFCTAHSVIAVCLEKPLEEARPFSLSTPKLPPSSACTVNLCTVPEYERCQKVQQGYMSVEMDRVKCKAVKNGDKPRRMFEVFKGTFPGSGRTKNTQDPMST